MLVHAYLCIFLQTRDRRANAGQLPTRVRQGCLAAILPSTMDLSKLAERLANLAPSGRIDWSDSWSDEDLNDFRAASLRRLDAEESEDRD